MTTAVDDTICGLGGNDLLFGMAGNDVVLGGPGNDVLIGGPGDDVLDGQDGWDVAIGAQALSRQSSAGPSNALLRERYGDSHCLAARSRRCRGLRGETRPAHAEAAGQGDAQTLPVPDDEHPGGARRARRRHPRGQDGERLARRSGGAARDSSRRPGRRWRPSGRAGRRGRRRAGDRGRGGTGRGSRAWSDPRRRYGGVSPVAHSVLFTMSLSSPWVFGRCMSGERRANTGRTSVRTLGVVAGSAGRCRPPGVMAGLPRPRTTVGAGA